jgi:hypothetical protein
MREIKKYLKNILDWFINYWFVTLVIFWFVILVTIEVPQPKYSVTAPGFSLRGVETYTEDKENRILEFDKNGRHYKFVGSYEIITNNTED